MIYEEYNKSLKILEKLLIHFINSGEIELVEKVCRLITECDQNYYQTLLIMANEEPSKNPSIDNLIEFRKKHAAEGKRASTTRNGFISF